MIAAYRSERGRGIFLVQGKKACPSLMTSSLSSIRRSKKSPRKFYEPVDNLYGAIPCGMFGV